MTGLFCLFLLFLSVIIAEEDTPQKAYQQFLTKLSHKLNQKINQASFPEKEQENKAILRVVVKEAFNDFQLKAQKPFYTLFEPTTISKQQVEKVAQLWPASITASIQKNKKLLEKLQSDKNIHSALKDMKNEPVLAKRQLNNGFKNVANKLGDTFKKGHSTQPAETDTKAFYPYSMSKYAKDVKSLIVYDVILALALAGTVFLIIYGVLLSFGYEYREGRYKKKDENPVQHTFSQSEK